MKVNIEHFKAMNDVERRFVETGKYDESDKDLALMINLYKMAGNLDQLKQRLSMEVAKNNQTINVYETMMHTMKQNAISNHGMQRKNLNNLHCKLKAKTAIVVGFGPSLIKNIEHLKTIQGKYKIIAVDRAIEYLHTNGVNVDYYITADPNCSPDWIPKMNLKGSKLIAITSSNHDFNKKFYRLGGDVYLFTSIDRLGMWQELQSLTGDLPYLNCSGNVGHAAIMAGLHLLEAKKLLLVGFDNSYGKHYYPDSKNVPSNDYDVLDVKDINGDTVKTNMEFLSYNHYMQESINNPAMQDRIVNCTEGGLLHCKHIDKLENY